MRVLEDLRESFCVGFPSNLFWYIAICRQLGILLNLCMKITCTIKVIYFMM